MATQAARSEATRRKILDAARDRFADAGWLDTSIDQIVDSAGVTKGALLHHFPDKASLLRAVYIEQERWMVDYLVAAPPRDADPLQLLRAGCHRFLEACLDPTFQRIAIIEAPIGLGWKQWRAIDADHGYGLLRGAVAAAQHSGLLRELPEEHVAQLLLAALLESALIIGNAPEPDVALTEVAATFDALLDGLANDGRTACA